MLAVTKFSIHSVDTLDAGTMVLGGCTTHDGLPPPLAQAQAGVSQVAAGGNLELGPTYKYALAWKGPPSNTLVAWGDPGPGAANGWEGGTPPALILDTLRSRLPGGKSLANVAQISAAELHALVLLKNGTLLAGYMPAMKAYALPPAGTVKGRLARVSASFGYKGDYPRSDQDYGGYSLGVDAA
jgi:hypothetical protein